MAERRFLAFDLGAESGRAVVGTLDEGRLALDVIHRFPNQPVEVTGTLHWNVLGIFDNVLKGARQYVARHGDAVAGIGIDTWGVDFALLAADGSLLQNPVHYRDHRTDGIPELITHTIPEPELHARTGISLLPIYTLCQMVALRSAESPILRAARGWLMMPDLLGYFLSGRRACERTNAITTQLYDPRRGEWHGDIFEAFDLPLEIMPEIIEPGTVLGELLEPVRRQSGLAAAPVIAPCTHDTASAVAAVPARGEDWLFLSCGTWSILGALTEQVVTTEEAFEAGLCNEMTLGSLFLCRNIMGLWILQQARAAWEAQGRSYTYPELAALAEKAPPGGPLIFPDDAAFLAPGDMTAAVAEFCERTDQPPPADVAATCRCIIESLALCYRQNADRLAGILGRRFGALHMVGGGMHNALLCRMTADATGMPVVAGPAEATVTGNLLVQALAAGCLEDAQDVRETVRRSVELVRYEPQDTTACERRYGEYRRIVETATA